MANANMTLAEKQKLLKSLVTKTQNANGGAKHVLSFASDRLDELKYSFIPTPSENVNAALSGGFARGKIAEVGGESGSGKTSLCLETIGLDHQKNPESIWGWLDTEGDFDWDYAQKKGIDPNRLMLWEVDDVGAEKGLDTLEMLIRSNVLTGVVVNSVTGLTPKKELENNMEKQEVAIQARMMSKLMRKIVAICNRTKTAILFINQTRTNVGVMYGDPNVTTGGKALAFFATQRIRMSKVKVQKEDGVTDDEAMKVNVRVAKNRAAHDNPYKLTSFIVLYGEGIDAAREIGQHCIDHGIVEVGGSWHYYPSKANPVTIDGIEMKFNSKGKFLQAIRDNEAVRIEMKTQLDAAGSMAQVMGADEIAAIEAEEKALEEEFAGMAE